MNFSVGLIFSFAAAGNNGILQEGEIAGLGAIRRAVNCVGNNGILQKGE